MFSSPCQVLALKKEEKRKKERKKRNTSMVVNKSFHIQNHL